VLKCTWGNGRVGKKIQGLRKGLVHKRILHGDLDVNMSKTGGPGRRGDDRGEEQRYIGAHTGEPKR